ncbi:hypothetical protein AAFF_G00100750 [Aldrovandia affinis]|uniref:Uncharacterized protein n=1 Tax=Aldrovandia affinis TaxID=143900 RepID=A0AAD7RUX8_9TELE|nr:hypothetical protein AAFF_G00100750 [Aldrovandia affinis]
MRRTYEASALSLTNHVEELQESFTAVMIQRSKSEKDHFAKEAQLKQDLRACADKVRCLEIELLETKRSYKAKIEERECSMKALKVLASTVKIRSHSPQVSQPNGSSETTKPFNIEVGSVDEEVLETRKSQQALLMSQPSVSTNRRWWTTQEHQQALLMSQPSVSSEENVWDTNRRLQTIPEQNGHSPSAGVGLPHSSLHPSQL